MRTGIYLSWLENSPALEIRLKTLYENDPNFYTKWGWGDLVKEVIYSIIDIDIPDIKNQCDIDNMSYLKDGDILFFFWMDDKQHEGLLGNLMYTSINTTGHSLSEIINKAPMTAVAAMMYIAENMILENMDYIIQPGSDED